MHIQLDNARQHLVIEHDDGPLEFGRGPRDEFDRCVVEDLAVSRDQMRLQELPGERIRIDNLSQRVPIQVRDRGEVAVGTNRELPLPLHLLIGGTSIEVTTGGPVDEGGGETNVLATIAAPVSGQEATELRKLLSGDAPDSETLTQWFETVVRVQQAAANSAEFYEHTAAAVVQLVGLDEGLVLLRSGGSWEIVARHGADDADEEPVSQRILDDVLLKRRTFYRGLEDLSPTASLANVSAAVASPITGPDGENVVGVVYGRRGIVSSAASPIRPLEAQLVQVLASAVGAGLSRLAKEAEATRWRVQLESFFTSRLVEELDRNPNLLDGDERDVTVLFADLRGFTECTARLGAAEACRLVGDVMDHLSTIVQRHHGVIVDYYGDGLMAMWNAPIVQRDHATRAVRAALDIQSELPEFGQPWGERLGEPLGVGVGVNSGNAVVGNVGSRQKFKYGALGLTVNLAQRIESVTKLVGIPVLCSNATLSNVSSTERSIRVGRCRLSGALEPVELFALPTAADEEFDDSTRDAYQEALTLFEGKAWDAAVERVAASQPLAETSLGRLLVDRSRRLATQNEPNPEPILDLRTK